MMSRQRSHVADNQIVMPVLINKFARFWSFVGFVFTLGFASGPRRAITEKAWVREASIELRYGLILHTHPTVSLRNINDIQIKDTLMGKIFGWQLLDIQSGDEQIILKNVQNAQRVKDTIYGLQNRL
ncbi:PH domain-containing protein [Leuconostoc fallax]|nr:PH domain-containing protein [Leuconostoc fallax]MBU7455339.1 PH domain-containing protein [Leuconostoc fallax]